MKLNLGCGTRKINGEGWVNVDRFGEPDVRHDLETFPWPWADGSVDEILMIHVLEHLGETADIYRQIWQEIYRVSQDGAKVLIQCPHPTSDDFLNDPTHIRAVTPVQFTLFDQEFNEECAKNNWANSPLGKYWGINFKIVGIEHQPSPWYLEKNPAKANDAAWLNAKATELRNQVSQFSVELKVVK